MTEDITEGNHREYSLRKLRVGNKEKLLEKTTRDTTEEAQRGSTERKHRRNDR